MSFGWSVLPQVWVAPLLGLGVLLLTPAAQASADAFALCEARLREAPGEWESARCFYAVASREKLWAEAARRIEAEVTRFPESSWLLLAAAYVEEELDARRADEKYHDAITVFAARGHAEGEVRARCELAAWLAKRGDLRQAEAQIGAAVRRAQTSGQSVLLGEALLFQARHLARQESGLERPYRLALQAEGRLFPQGPIRQRLLCLDLLARLARDLGRSGEAEGYYRRLGALAREHGERLYEGESQFGLGLLLFDELDRTARGSGRDKAAARIRQALAVGEEMGHSVLQAKARSILSLLEPDQAETHAERCLTLARGRNDALTTSCLLTLARRAAGVDPADAERYLEEAGEVAVRSGDLSSLARFWYERMSFSWRFQPRARAVADTLEALRAVEALRDRQLEQAGRAGLFSRWLAPYYTASGYFLTSFLDTGDPADLDRAFAIAESLRARVLRDLLAARRSPDPPATRSAVEAALAPEEALLSFQIAPQRDLFGFAGGSWLLVSTHRGTRVYPLAKTVDRAGLETSVSALRGLIERRDGGEAELAVTLHNQLLSRALADLPREVDQLVIVPDGVLHLLPFPALRSRDGSPLTDRYQVSVAPSATLWSRWRRQTRSPARAALVLADPARPLGLQGAAERGGGEAGRLPWARREGRYVARRCGAGSLLRLGPDAGEAFLKRQDLSRFGVLHLAAHAVADEASPETSAVLLAADVPGEDGRLQVDEIARLHLRGSLVALSSCRSAGGALMGGEGVMSLTRAFFAAGSATVVGSLWPLRDDDAEAFFTLFYDRLSAGDTAAAAFTAAQRERIRDGAPAQAWAGLVLAGDDNWRLPPGSRREGLWGAGVLIGAALVALLGGYALVHRRWQGVR